MTDAAKNLQTTAANADHVDAVLDWDAFFTDVPVYEKRSVALTLTLSPAGVHAPEVKVPHLELFCPSATCGGIRFFDPTSHEVNLHNLTANQGFDRSFYFRCRNCNRTQKAYFVRMWTSEIAKDATFTMFKIGEFPAFGEPRPNVVKDVLDDEIEFFDRGYRSETAGLGIGAFAYYRRFVESHKNKIIGAIKEVAVTQGAAKEMIDGLDRALKANSFEAAVKAVKDGIPDSLRYAGGHNPLTLIHSALSEGLHSEDDVTCLELAQDIRLLLTDLAERTTQALKNSTELDEAVKRMLTRKSAKATAAASPA